MSGLLEYTSQIIIYLYQFIDSLSFVTGGQLGLTIILFTIIVRSILIPITLPSLKAQKKMREIQPELNKLKKKHGKDKKAMQTAQMELYKKYNVNPLAGCVPQIVQLVVLVVLYQTLMFFLEQDSVNGVVVNTQFLWLDLTLPDPTYILPVLAGGFQFLMSLMIAPGGETRDIVPNNSKNLKVQEANKKEEGMADMAGQMQKQMMFVMPVMTFFLATRFPSGLALYWVTTTIFSIAQQYLVSGPGGLTLYLGRAKAFYKNTLSARG